MNNSKYQALSSNKKNIYSEKGIYQTSLLLDTATNEINWLANLPEEFQKEYIKRLEIQATLKKYIDILKSQQIDANTFTQILSFAKELLSQESEKDFSIYKTSKSCKILFIQFMTLLLNKKMHKKHFYELSCLFFQKENLINLNYNPEIYYPELDQGTLGLIRHKYYCMEHQKRIKEIKK